jgi:hypothetical protein
MKERFFVGTLNEHVPELDAVTWFENKPDAIIEIQRRKAFYFREVHVLAKVLNVPSTVESKEGTPK